MDAVVTQELLTEIFDKTAREVTEQESGIRLRMGSTPPDGELCTVSIPLPGDFTPFYPSAPKRASLPG